MGETEAERIERGIRQAEMDLSRHELALIKLRTAVANKETPMRCEECGHKSPSYLGTCDACGYSQRPALNEDLAHWVRKVLAYCNSVAEGGAPEPEGVGPGVNAASLFAEGKVHEMRITRDLAT